MRDLANLSPLAIWHSRIDLEHEVGRFGDGDLCERLLAEAATENAGRPEPGRCPETRDGAGRGRSVAMGDRRQVADDLPQGPNGLTEAVEEAAARASRYPKSLTADRWTWSRATRSATSPSRWWASVRSASSARSASTRTRNGAPLFLQIKEARPSVIGQLALNPFSVVSEGQRVIDGQRIMQAASDLFLGTAVSEASGRSYYVRQLKKRKLSAVAEILSESGAKAYAQLCGTTLARAHARSGDAAMIAGYLGKGSAFEDAIAEFAMTYARQSISDHALLVEDFLTQPTPDAA